MPEISELLYLIPTVSITTILGIVLFKKELAIYFEKINIPLQSFITALILLTLALVSIQVGIPTFVINYFFVVVCVLAIFLGLIVNRNYLLIVGLLFIAISIPTAVTRLDIIAEYFSLLGYVLLVFYVLRNVLYDKIFEN